jgi:Cu-processing system permease protein
VFVLIYDLSLLGILIVTKGAVGAGYFPYLLLMNPTDIFRLINLSGFEAAQVQAGLMSLSNAEILSPSFLLIALLVWIIVPLLIAIRLFKRQSL